MADRAVLLSGEHASLPRAELEALLAVHDPGAVVEVLSPTVVRVTPTDPAGTDAALRCMALAHAWGTYWGHTDGGDQASLEAIVARHADGAGSTAVAATRTGADRSHSTAQLERLLGTTLAAAGHAIDLRTPDRLIAAWLHGETVVVAEQRGVVDRSRFESRKVTGRAHFSPVTLHPRRAASLVHLARVATGGRVLDPFCGTGGFVLEAALEGYEAWGSDLDGWMVQGTLQTLADTGPEPLDGTVFQADIGGVPALVGMVDGIVTDLPYGRASSTDREALADLYGRAFHAFAAVLAPGHLAVVGCPDPALVTTASAAAGFTLAEAHEEYVHRSLTRHWMVLRRG